MPQPGNLVGQRYCLLAPLASGGMGTVWRARHVELEVEVAVKFLSSELNTPTALRRFRNEAQAAARLRNPNVVQVLDFGEHEGHPYLAMELLRGEDLSQRLAAVGCLSCEAALPIIDGLSKALQLAHDEGIVHRDLKPGNIFLERIRTEEVVKVLDFGIAKDTRGVVAQAKTTEGGVVGSPAYMSPEQVFGDAVGPETDLWAMGVVAFEMVTGTNPFEDDKLAKIFDRILRQPIPSARHLKPELSVAIEGFFQQALARKPSDRFESPLAFFHAFQRATLGTAAPRSSIRAYGDAATEHAERPRLASMGRRPLVLLAVLSLAVGVMAVFLISSWRRALPTRGAELEQAANDARPAPTQPLASRVMGEPSADLSTLASPSAAVPLVPTARAEVTLPTSVGSASSAKPRAPATKPKPAASTAQPPLDPRFGIPVGP